MNKKILLVISVLFLCMIVIFTGCNSNLDDKNDSISSSPTSQVSSTEILGEILSLEKIEHYRDFINGIAFKAYFSYRPHYIDSPNEYAQLYTIPLEGVPVLIDETSKSNSSEENYTQVYPNYTQVYPRSLYEDYWQYGTITLLRCYEWHFKFNGDPAAKAENFYNLFTSAKNECSQILSSDNSVEQQIQNLRYYGILAVPYVQDEINKGHTEYEPFFTEIGLHLTADEFAQIVSEIAPNTTTRYDNVRNHTKAEDFDYKVWLSENEEDLNNLFKFLDAYCAEYEAEQNK